MKVIVNRVDPITRNSVCAIGSFDGIHRGHQRIIRYLKNLAYPGKKIGLITFQPLPFFVLHHAPICCLTPREEKEEILKELGVDFIYYFKFTQNFAQQSPTDFVRLIARKIAPSIVVVGKNFHFGRNRRGSSNSLEKLAHGFFDIRTLPILKDEGVISSTRIRELLLLGHVSAANKLLGREYQIAGTVVRGKGKGARLGFPTINIDAQKDKLLPLDGVYSVKVMFDRKELLGAMFLRHRLIEVHLVHFRGNLYKKMVSIRITQRIRDIATFRNDEALKSAIASDIKKIK